MPEPNPKIEALNLNDIAKRAAYQLKAKHLGIVFTSGRRDKCDQARAMAGNVIHNRKWIAQTYVANSVSAACQRWVDEHSDANTSGEIAAGLLSVLNGFNDAELRHLSKHLSGDAFDVQPVAANAARIKADIRALPGLEKFLDREGGLVRWHAQFSAS